MAVGKKSFVNNFLWRFLERCGAQGVTFIVSLVLARILGPEEYGIISLVTVFTTIMQVFVDSGLGNALIQKKDADDTDFSSVFYFNIVLCVALYSIMFIAAPLISALYSMPELTPIIRVLSLVLVISGVKNIQQAYVSRKLLFKKLFFASVISTIISGIIGIVMAVRGYGVWALVAQSLSNRAISTILLVFIVRWRPRLLFSWQRLKGLLSYGYKLLLAKLLDTVYNDLRTLIIGRMYSATDLGFYNRGKQFPHLIVSNINTTIDSVLFPTMSYEQDKKDKLKALTRRSIATSTYVMMPIMMGIAVCAKPLVTVVLTEKWLSAVFFMRIFCFTYAFYPIATANLNAIKALGRSDLFLKLEVAKKVVGVIALLSTMFISVEAMAYSLLATSIISQIINSFPNKSLLEYSYLNQLKDMMPQIVLSVAMGLMLWPFELMALNPWVQLAIQIPLGVMIYVTGSYWFKIESFTFLLETLKGFFGEKKRRSM